MAVGIIIGAAFGKIVSSLVSDVVTPPLGYVIGGVDFTKLAVTMPAMREGAERSRSATACSCRRCSISSSSPSRSS